MSTPDDPVDVWFERRFATLDLAGLTDEERERGSIFLGGINKKFVVPGDDFEYGQVKEVVFNWGDPKAEAAFAVLLEHDDRPNDPQGKSLEHELVPFSAATRVKDELWSLTLQRKSFDPAKDYEDPSHYIEIPFDAQAGYQRLKEALNASRPTPQLIGKVGLAWVYFEMGMNISGNDPANQEILDHSIEHDEILIEDLLHDIEKLIRTHDFERASVEDNNQFATHIVFWLLETFAQGGNDGEFILYPHAGSDGFNGEELPTAMKSLVLHSWKDEPFYSDDNRVKMETDYQFETVQSAQLPIDITGMTMTEIADYFRDQPEEAALIQEHIIGYTPQIKLTLQPKEHNGWSMEYTVNPLHISLLPLVNSTSGSSIKNVKTYLQEAMHHPAELARSVCELALLAARHTNHVTSGQIPVEKLLSLQDRLAGTSPLPLIKGQSYARTPDWHFIQLPLQPRE